MKFSTIMQSVKKDSKEIEFMPTGISKLDEFLDGGLMKKELVILGGFTGSGKSYLAGQIALNIAKEGFNTAYFSLEISNKMVATRLVGQIANVKAARISGGLLTANEHEERIMAEGEVEAYDNFLEFVDDQYRLVDISKTITEGKFEFVVIDFIQNVLHSKDGEYERLSSVALELQQLAKRLNCCILILSQLSNDAAKSMGGQVEYKGSGSIATVADLGLYLERTEVAPGAMYQPLRLYIKKNRRGFSGGELELKMRFPGCLITQNEPQMAAQS